MTASIRRHPSSYRDPAGFIFEHEGVIYRQVNPIYQSHYDKLMQSGLYQRLVDAQWLLPHVEVEWETNTTAYKILKPTPLPFISYPHEWCFSQLKEAARLTLRIQSLSLEYGMSLKDATPFNIQFLNGRPVFIDTLSWEILDEQKPWVAYRQFCETFLAPLALGHYQDQPIARTYLAWPEGIPLKLASRLLPFKSRLNLDLALHLHLHARISSPTGSQPSRPIQYTLQKRRQLIASLTAAIERCGRSAKRSGWTEYYEEAAKRNDYLTDKNNQIINWLKEIGPVVRALDAGCNTGHFSEALRAHAKLVVAIDGDEASVESLVDRMRTTERSGEADHELLPLVQDLTELSSDKGLLNAERQSFLSRGPFDLVLGLALLHQLLIARQVPMQACASLFAKLTDKTLVIEFVPMSDPWAATLLRAKEGQSHPYDQAAYETTFGNHFRIRQQVALSGSERILYWLEKL